jgi:hypothetical protein
MAGEENKALIRRLHMEIDEGNLDAIELVAENYLDHSPPPLPGIGPGREGLKQSFPMFWDATPGGIKSRIKSPKATRSSPGSPPTAYTNPRTRKTRAACNPPHVRTTIRPRNFRGQSRPVRRLAGQVPDAM